MKARASELREVAELKQAKVAQLRREFDIEPDTNHEASGQGNHHGNPAEAEGPMPDADDDVWHPSPEDEEWIFNPKSGLFFHQREARYYRYAPDIQDWVGF